MLAAAFKNDNTREGMGMQKQYPIGVLKQEIIKIYNSINQEIFGIGIKSQKIEISGDKAYIFATHKRIPALKILDEAHRSVTANVDALVMEANKKMLKEQIEKTLGLKVKLVLKDYDPITEFSGTVIVFQEEFVVT
ncbi:Na-translocating system protein MpsC family protein [Brevibacillus massiliensis]|uniref:Na-translocating system protein MpsC family protein n=1 Tax=Brevibacillus massiliensis TaxID=1118054 RepID=UPI0002E54E9D|nr:Na-translocating system protein MpsC family protein [Brevibacillus massiliensis]